VAGFKGDGMSKSIVDNYIGDGFLNSALKDVYRQQVETGRRRRRREEGKGRREEEEGEEGERG